MENEYFGEINRLLNRAYPELAAEHKLELKNFFGAVLGYIDGNIFITCGNFGTALKLPAQTLDQLLAMKDVKSLKYFPKGATKKGYAVLPRRIINNKNQFKDLLGESIDHALKLS